MQVKEQAKEEVAQLLNMENEAELNRVGDKAPGEVKNKFHANPGGRNQPYIKRGAKLGDTLPGSTARRCSAPPLAWPATTARSLAT